MRRPIGGFFELEIGVGGGPYHPSAIALSSGRACLRCILERLRPSRVWVPFYICDAALQASSAAGIAVELYPIDDALEPILPVGAPADGECVVYVNYFGLKTSAAQSLGESHGGRVIIDDTHAFFVRGYSGGWSFNSARKFFGVPDGGYAYGPLWPTVAYPPTPDVHYDHLVSRLLGLQDLAYAQYLQNEARVTTDVWRMSALSERLLASVDYPVVRSRRRQNFATLDEAFSRRNGLPSHLTPAAADVPYCYPLLLSEPVPWNEFWSRGVFVPRLWKEVADRPRAREFVRESMLVDRLLPLPIDHRYGAEDLNRLVDIVREVMRW